MKLARTFPLAVTSIAAFLAFAPGANAACSGESLTYSAANEAAMSDAVTCLLNAERTSRGLPALARDIKLDTAARNHSADMANNNYFDHNSQDGTTFSQRITNAGYTWVSAGENIAAGQRTPRAVMSAWMGSEGHCQNILSGSWADLGVGVASGGSYGIYWTHDFARRSGGPPSSGAATGCPYTSLVEDAGPTTPSTPTACATILKIDSARRATGGRLRVKGRIGPEGCSGKLRFTVKRGSSSLKRTKSVLTKSFTVNLRVPKARGKVRLAVKLGDDGPTARRTVKP